MLHLGEEKTMSPEYPPLERLGYACTVPMLSEWFFTHRGSEMARCTVQHERVELVFFLQLRSRYSRTSAHRADTKTARGRSP